MADLASLVVSVDSSSVPTATASLKGLGTAAQETEAATDSLTRRQDAFLQSLDRQAATMGRGADALRAYKAEQLGLSDDKTFLNLSKQIQDLEQSGPSAIDRMATKVENRMGTMVLRMGVHMALVTGIVGGITWTWDELTNSTQKWLDLGNKSVGLGAQQASSMGNLVKAMDDERNSMMGLINTRLDAEHSQERQNVLRAEMMALGPEYRNALVGENGLWADQLTILRQINDERLKTTNDQIAKMEATPAHRSNKTALQRGMNLNPTAFGLMGLGINYALKPITGMLKDSADRDNIEAETERNKGLDALYKSRAELMKTGAQLDGAYDRPGNGTGTGDSTTQYGREIERLQEQLVALTMSERDAEELKLRLMDNGAGGSVNKAMDLYDQVEAMKALGVAEKERSKEGASALDYMLQLHERYELIGADLETQLRYKMMDKGLTANEISQMVELTKGIQDKTDALERQKNLQSEADRLNKPAGDERTRIEEMYRSGMISADLFEAQIKKVEKAELQLKANGGDLWAGMALQVEGFSNRATDAFVNFTMGASAGWRDMVTSMIRDMERFVVQQQLMGPLFKELGLMFLPGSGPDMTYQMGGSSYVPYPTTPGLAGGSAPVSSSIVVNVGPGAADTPSKSATGGTALGQQIEAAVNAVLIKNQRSGGLLSPGGR